MVLACVLGNILLIFAFIVVVIAITGVAAFVTKD